MYYTRVLKASNSIGTSVYFFSVLENAGKIARSGSDIDIINLIDKGDIIIIQLSYYSLNQAEKDEYIVVVSKYFTGCLVINLLVFRETSNLRKILTGT